MTENQTFTPALGHAGLTPLYDSAIALMTREKKWRSALVELINPGPEDSILDVGCGTGTLALQLKRAAPEAYVLGIDPDAHVLERARKKEKRERLFLDWQESFLTPELSAAIYPMTKVVSSLVLHQTPVAAKKSILACAWEALEPGGTLFIADYGQQRTKTMRALFRSTVQAIDGVEDTRPNAEGKLPEYIYEAGFEAVEEHEVIPTLSGSISIYTAQKSAQGGDHDLV